MTWSAVIWILLAACWAAYLLPQVFRWLSDRRADSLSSMNSRLAVLDRTNPQRMRAQVPVPSRVPGQVQAGVTSSGPSAPLATQAFAPRAAATLLAPPRTRAEAARRRLQVLVALASLAAVTFAAAMALGGPAVLVHLLVDSVLVGFGCMAYQLDQRQVGAAAGARTAPAPAPAARRSASPAAQPRHRVAATTSHASLRPALAGGQHVTAGRGRTVPQRAGSSPRINAQRVSSVPRVVARPMTLSHRAN